MSHLVAASIHKPQSDRLLAFWDLLEDGAVMVKDRVTGEIIPASTAADGTASNYYNDYPVSRETAAT